MRNDIRKAYFAASERRAIIRDRKRMDMKRLFKALGNAVQTIFEKPDNPEARAAAEARRKAHNKAIALYRAGKLDDKPSKVSAKERKANRAITKRILAKRQARNAILNARHVAVHPLSRRCS